MYGGRNHSAGYYYQYGRRRRRKDAKRVLMLLLKMCLLILVSLLVAGLIVLAIFLLPKLHLKRVYAATEADTVSESEDTVVEVVSQNALYIAMTDVQALVEERISPVIFLDAGHGGEDAGCSGGGVEEKTINLEIAKRVQSRLRDFGYNVVMARDSDVYVSKEDRVKHANALSADIYVSIHQNAAEEGDGISGMEVWYDGSDEVRENKRLAQLIRQQTAKSTEATERELRGDADFHVTGSTTMPACLIETGFLSDSNERGKLVTPEYQEKIAEGIAQGIEYYFHPKTMYLTFDDGPSAENTERVLDILKERGIQATFFLVGKNVEQHPEVAKRIAAEGHTIGIHSNTHDYREIYADVDSFVRDFEAAHQTVYEVTGVDAKLFRFPGGSINAYNEKVSSDIIERMTEMGYIYYDWNASLEDAVEKSTPEILIANGVATTLGRQKVVMLAHDVVYNTGICLNELLDSLPEYRMRTLDESVEPVQFRENSLP